MTSKLLLSVISNKLDGPMLNVMIGCAADYYLPKGELNSIYNTVLHWKNEPYHGKKQQSGFPTKSDTNQAVQPHRIVRSLKFQI